MIKVGKILGIMEIFGGFFLIFLLLWIFLWGGGEQLGAPGALGLFGVRILGALGALGALGFWRRWWGLGLGWGWR